MAALSGEEGSVVGILVGALVMTVRKMGCQIRGWDNYIQQIVTGTINVRAFALDRLRHT